MNNTGKITERPETKANAQAVNPALLVKAPPLPSKTEFSETQETHVDNESKD